MIQGGERRGAPALEGGWERAPGKGLTQRSRIITHMAGNAYFTLIKSVFFFVRLSEDPPAAAPRAASPSGRPFFSLPAEPALTSSPRVMGR